MKHTAVVAALAVGCALAAGHSRMEAQAPAQQEVRPQPPRERDPLTPAPNRRADEGRGPFKTLVLRGAILIDGSGAPPVGPVDIVIEQNRIQAVRSAGTPGLPLRQNRPPENPDLEIDVTGMYVMPGFVSLHEHAGGAPKNPDAEYPYKLWLAHGVTTVVGVPLTSHQLAVSERERSHRNEIVAPRLVNFQRPGAGWGKGGVDSPEAAREWVRWAAANGVEGLKVGAHRPEIMAVLMEEARELKLGSIAHLQQTGVAHMNALDAARLGLRTVTHFYGHFEALMTDYVVQPWPVDQINDDEQMRFAQVARLWDKIHPPGSPEWKEYLQEHRKLGTVFDPTMTAYAAGRDLMRMRHTDWHARYSLPSLMDFYAPSRANHGSYWFYWTLEDEIAWRNFYQVWFRLLNDYRAARSPPPAVLGARDDLVLQRPRQVAEVVAVPGHAHDEVAVLLGVRLRRAQRVGRDDVELHVVAVEREVRCARGR
jgi:hypothetical protein